MGSRANGRLKKRVEDLDVVFVSIIIAEYAK
jgi:hypothetical protein